MVCAVVGEGGDRAKIRGGVGWGGGARGRARAELEQTTTRVLEGPAK